MAKRKAAVNGDKGIVNRQAAGIPKTLTGIDGLDEITRGGLPTGRPTLICGGPGCGKTVMGMEFVYRGIELFDENGLFVSFEEPCEALVRNFSTMNWDLDALRKQKKLGLMHIEILSEEITEAGEYDLAGLFARMGQAIDQVGAKRVVLDTLESIFSGLSNTGILRAEIRRLLGWLAKRGVTVIITSERGQGSLTRHGLEEYVSDCVIDLDHRVDEQVSTRRLRILKYRGSEHGSNEYPFLIGEGGNVIMPVTSAGLDHPASRERVSSGIVGIDKMLGGKGFFKGSSVLISGTAGTGKTSLACRFVEAACSRGEKALYLAYEESPRQIERNMSSVGIQLGDYLKKGNLVIKAARPTLMGLEGHIMAIFEAIRREKPDVLVMDPITNFASVGSLYQIKLMLIRLVDHLKSDSITSVFTNLNKGDETVEQTDSGVSSLMDCWLAVSMQVVQGRRRRLLEVLKSRGMAHSASAVELVLGDKGISIGEMETGFDG